MTTSKTIAGLIGPTLVAIAAGMLLNIGERQLAHVERNEVRRAYNAASGCLIVGE
jgi:hypothetical protein